MKYTTALVSAAIVLNGAFAAEHAVPVLSNQEAMKAVQNIDMPAGVTFLGTSEPLKEPKATDVQQKSEQFIGGGILGGWNGWGLGGFLPYRFGFTCGGVPGWAYPLGYWNAYGLGLYGGGCGLGFPYGGLYYC